MAAVATRQNGSLDSLRQTLAAISGSEPTDELATLLLLVNELYADASCRCEKEKGEEAAACNRDVGVVRETILDGYRRLIDTLHLKGARWPG